MTEIGTRRLVSVGDPPDFDPQKHVIFRGRPIHDLTREELIEALTQAWRPLPSLAERWTMATLF